MDAVAEGPITIDTPLGDDVKFHAMNGDERISQLFAYEIDVLSSRPDLNAADLLGHTVTVSLQHSEDDAPLRHWHGCVTGFQYVGTGDDEFSRYQLTVHPWLWYLTQSADCRIFQNMSIPDIIAKVFRDRGFTDFENVLTETYEPREYVVQYRESDFDFVSRLMQREGIYYFFRHVKDHHTLILADAQSAHEPTPGCGQLVYAPPDSHRDATREYVRRWQALAEVATGQVAHADFDFTHPRLRLHATRNTSERNAPENLEVYDYPGDFSRRSTGEAYAGLRLEQRRARAKGWTGETNNRGLVVGNTFHLVEHPRQDQNREYLVVDAQYRLRGHDLRSSGSPDADPFSCSFRVIPADATFRAPVVTRTPTMFGPQTAIVVGPAAQEIWTDQYGRVKVQFHWDREGASDENSSCYVRVSQAWAGSGWGAQFIPRIGQEVVVDFLEGDPDKPIITGSVYNGANMPPFPLPQNGTQSGIRTRSTPRGSQVNCNEIRFEDAKGSEDLFIQAEKTQTTVVKNDQTIDIGGNRSKSVEKNESIRIGGDRTKSVAGNESIRVIGGRTTSVTLDEATSVLGLQTLAVAGARSVHVTGDESHSVLGNRSAVVTGSESLQITGDLAWRVTGRVDANTEDLHSETFGKDFVSRHTGHRVVVVGSTDASSSASTHVDGSASGYVSETLDVVAIKGMTIRCGKTEIRLTPDAVTISSLTILLTGKDVKMTGDKVNLAGADSITVGSAKVTLTSSDASVLLDSNATVQGTKVQLKGGGGASGDDDKKKKKKTTIKLVDHDGKPLANQRITLREGGEGGTERTVVLDDKGSIEVDGDGPFEAIVPDLPDAKAS